jgi:hypothetical protein
MSVTRCCRVRDLAVTAVAFAVIAVLTATGYQSWTAATAGALIPIYFVLATHERRKK